MQFLPTGDIGGPVGKEKALGRIKRHPDATDPQRLLKRVRRGIAGTTATAWPVPMKLGSVKESFFGSPECPTHFESKKHFLSAIMAYNEFNKRRHYTDTSTPDFVRVKCVAQEAPSHSNPDGTCEFDAAAGFRSAGHVLNVIAICNACTHNM